MEKHINAYRLQARLVQEVVTINPTWGDAKQAWQDGYNTALMSVVDRLEEMPAVDVQKMRHGRWEHYAHIEPQYDINGVKTWGEAYQCSNCGFIHSVIENFGHYAYCPNCGSRMVDEG